MATNSVPARLPVWEQAVYWVAEIFTILYMLYSLYCASADAWREDEPIEVDEGWTLIGRPKDIADIEWRFWSTFFWKLLPWMCGHVVLSMCICLSVRSVKIRHFSLALYGMVATSCVMGFRAMLFLCVQPVVMFVASWLKNSVVVWLTTLTFLSVLNFYSENIEQMLYDSRWYSGESFEMWFFMCLFVWTYMCLRATAFALECVWVPRALGVPVAEDSKAKGSMSALGDFREKKQSISHSQQLKWPTLSDPPGWLDMLLYMFYLPLFFTGPQLSYNNFHTQSRRPQLPSARKVGHVLLMFVRILFWGMMNSVTLHFIYPHAITSNNAVLAKQSRWTLISIGYVLGQFCMTKYVVLFGASAQFARLDGFEPPTVPACISYIYCYSDMWKAFDRGLFNFMKRYIFIPCGGSRAGLGQQLLASALCFSFVFFWHGAEYYLFLWCLVNFVETSLEKVGGMLENTATIKKHVYSRLSAAGVRRFRALMSVPLFLMSIFAMFFFFGGYKSGNVFWNKLMVDISWPSFSFFVLMIYCAIQNAMEVERLGLTKIKTRTHQS